MVLLAQDDQVTSVQADIRQPELILEHPEVTRLIDFGQPVGLLCVAVLQLVSDTEDPAGIIARFRDRMSTGSYLVLSQFTSASDEQAMAQLRGVAAGTPVETYFRPLAQIMSFCNGFDLVEPGLALVQDWRASWHFRADPAEHRWCRGPQALKAWAAGSAGQLGWSAGLVSWAGQLGWGQ